VTAGARTTIVTQGAEEISSHPPLALLSRCLQAFSPDTPPEKWAGGAVGYFSYDLARRYIKLPTQADGAGALPEMAIGIYDGMIVVDHMTRRCQIHVQQSEQGFAWGHRILNLLHQPHDALPAFHVHGTLHSNMRFGDYEQAFQNIQRLIQAGDCYQVNLAMRFSACFSGHPWHAYVALRQSNPATYGAWLNLPFAKILSSSPESFLQVDAGQVETRPIKGTRPRHQDARLDADLAADLACSVKDRAENLMIVDLLRNDLGKVCVPGSIQVPELFRVESYATVHHLISQVRGRLYSACTPLDVLAATFPGGSITGAPKLRAMQIIESLESQRRGVYCGSIGYLGFDAAMHLNIAIRTLVCSHTEVSYWVGSGVVADSEVAAEYQECLDKGVAIQRVLHHFQHVEDLFGA